LKAFPFQNKISEAVSRRVGIYFERFFMEAKIENEDILTKFETSFHFAKNLYNNALAFIISYEAGRRYMAETMLYSEFIPVLDTLSTIDYTLNLERFDMSSPHDSDSSRLSLHELSLKLLWIELRVNYIKRARSDDPSKLRELQEKFIEHTELMPSIIGRHLHRIFYNEYMRLYNNTLFFKKSTISNNTPFLELINHAIWHDSRARQAFINLGWLNKELKLTTTFRSIVNGTSLSRDILSVHGNTIFETRDQTTLTIPTLK
jgi:hypothetical protein